MDLLFKILTVLTAIIGTTAAVYNVITARSFQKQVADAKKLDDAVAEGRRNTQDIANLTRRMDDSDERTEKRLDQIGKDVADLKKLFTDFIIENLRRALAQQ